MQEVAKVLGISLGDCQVGTRRQGVQQEKRRKEEAKQKKNPELKEKIEERELIEWGKIKVESFLDMKMEDSLDKEKFACTECNKQFKRNDHLKRHKLKHTPDGEYKIRFPCTNCDRTFSLAFKLKIHIKDSHPDLNEVPGALDSEELYHQVLNEASSNIDDDAINSEELFACTYCSKTFKNKKQRYKHASSIHSGVEIKCDECDKQFSRKDKLNRHKKNIHLM